MRPRVSVLLPIYNAAAYLGTALDSLLAQTWADFEIVAIDDGSVDASGALLDRYAAQERRIRAFHQPNGGLSATLNRALELATGEYAARMDADDICLPERLAWQVRFLDQHAEVGVLGSWLEAFDQAGVRPWHYPVGDEQIRCQLLFNSPVAHPAVMYRPALVRQAGGYKNDFPVAQDYELWVRLAQVTRFANLPELLLRRRTHPAQMSANASSYAAEVEAIHRMQLGLLNLPVSIAEYAIHRDLSNHRVVWSPRELAQAETWLLKLRVANQAARLFPEPAFARSLSERWWEACYHARSQGWWVWQRYRRSPLRREVTATHTQEMRFGTASAWHELRRAAGLGRRVHD